MGQAFRFIHCGDLHLGAPFKYLKSLGKFGDGAISQATYKAFEKVVDMVLEERVDALLISGDVYNGADHNLEAQVRFVRQLERTAEKGIPVFIVHGNHDPLALWSAKVPLPKNVHVFGANRVERVPLLVRGREVAAIYGISHDHNGIYDNLSRSFKAQKEDVYSIGLLHASVAGQGGHGAYAPCTLDDLKEAGMDYWALGHIHQRQILHQLPFIVYPGNTQGLSKKELGAKGCYLVRISNAGHTDLMFRETCFIRFENVEIDISALSSVQDMEEMIRHKKKILSTKHKQSILMNIKLVGAGPLSPLCKDEETRDLWLRSVQEEEKGKFNFVLPIDMEDDTTLPIDLKERRHLPDVLGDYLAAYDEMAKWETDIRIQELRDCIENRPEKKRLGTYKELLTDEMLERAFKRAEIEGAMRLLGDIHEH